MKYVIIFCRHPDKSDNPKAEEKFVEIKKAYELLADAERRKAYDLHGITNEDAKILKGSHDYSNYGRFAPDPFEEFFGYSRKKYFHFKLITYIIDCFFFFLNKLHTFRHRFHFDEDITLFHKLSITTKYYETHVLPNSNTNPYILMFYADWCFSCIKTASAFKKMIDTLEPLGITFATVNAGHEEQLLRKAGVHSLPCIVLILDGKNYVYKENVFSVQRIVDFIRQKLPYKLIQNIYDQNVKGFLEGWNDNRVRGLIMEPRQQPRLRYLLTAFRFKQRVAFGYVFFILINK